MKPTIICITGNSGSGKTHMAEYLEQYYGIPMIRSYTDRTKRSPDEDSHTFISIDEFNHLKIDDMIAYTNFGGNNYCCLKEDVSDGLNSYVIDEDGLVMLKSKYPKKYRVYSVKIKRDSVDVEADRINRDEGRFNLPDESFDYIIKNDKEIGDFNRSIIELMWSISSNGCSCSIGGCKNG